MHKMNQKNTKTIRFGDTEIEKHKIHQHKILILINNIEINVSFGKKGFKYFIGYKEKEKKRLLCILIPKMSAYRRDIDESKYIFLF